MKSKWSKVAISSITALSLIAAVPASYPVKASAASQQSSATISSQQVNLTQNAVASIRSAQFLVQEQGKVLAFTVAIKNSGASPINLIDYWVRVKNKSGKKYILKLAEVDRKKGTVVGGTTTNLTYYAVVDPETKLDDIVYDIVKWDFSVSNYERLLGSISTPANTTGKTAAFKAGNILVENTELKGEIKSLIVTNDQTNTNATVQFAIENVGAKSVDLSKINFFVQTDDLSVYKVEASLQKKSISPKEKSAILLNISVPNSISNKPLTLIPSISEGESKVELPLGAYALPELKATAPTKVNGTQTVTLEEQAIQTRVIKSELVDNDGRQVINVEFELTNKSKRSIKLPNIEFLLETDSGVQYPLVYEKTEDVKLLPNIVKELKLAGDVPNKLNLNTSKIVLKTVATDNISSYTLALYNLKGETPVVNTDSMYKTTNYQVDLKSINRIPNDLNDILVAELTITNNSNKAIKIPDLSGHYMIDGVEIETLTNEVALDNSINLAPKSTHQFVVYTKIPYTSNINDVSFVLTEKVKDKPAKELFKYKAQVPEMVGQSIKSPYVIGNIGRRASVQVTKSAINQSQSDNANYFYGEFELVNKETRSVSVTQLGGYLEDSAGLLIPITFTSVNDRVMPNGKALYAAYGRLPADFKNQNYKLYVGQAIPITVGEKSESLLVSPVAYKMNTQQSELKTTLQGIEFGGYKLDISEIISNVRIKDNVIYEGIELNLKYNLNKNPEYQATPKEQKLMIELVDHGAAKATYSKEYTLSGEEKDLIYTGNDIRLPIFFEDAKMMTKINSFQNFDLNIYTTFGENKLLLATKEVRWFYADRTEQATK